VYKSGSFDSFGFVLTFPLFVLHAEKMKSRYAVKDNNKNNFLILFYLSV